MEIYQNAIILKAVEKIKARKVSEGSCIIRPS